MDKNNIEITFTEEERKSFNNPGKDTGYKTMSEKQKVLPPTSSRGGFFSFFFSYDTQQKVVFTTLIILFIIIILCLRMFRDPFPQNPIAQNPSQSQENTTPPAPEETPLPQRQSLFLSKGDEAPIVDENNQGLSHILVGVGWDPAEVGHRMDVDSSIVLVDENYNNDYVVYYRNLQGPNWSVVHHGDNLTGNNFEFDFGRSASNDDENIDVYLNKVPSNYNKIYFILNIFRAYERNQSLSGVKNMYINIYDPAHNSLLMTYTVTGDTLGTAIILGVATRGETVTTQEFSNMGTKSYSLWSFRALGNTYYAEDIDQLRDVCKRGGF